MILKLNKHTLFALTTTCKIKLTHNGSLYRSKRTVLLAVIIIIIIGYSSEIKLHLLKNNLYVKQLDRNFLNPVISSR